MSLSSALTVVGYAGVGTVIAALVRSLFGRKEADAHSASMIVDAASGFTGQVTAENQRLDEENKRLRQTLVILTDKIDAVLDKTKPQIGEKELKEANKAAKVVL